MMILKSQKKNHVYLEKKRQKTIVQYHNDTKRVKMPRTLIHEKSMKIVEIICIYQKRRKYIVTQQNELSKKYFYNKEESLSRCNIPCSLMFHGS